MTAPSRNGSSPNGSSPDGRLAARQFQVQLDGLAGGGLCVRVAGELDLATTEELHLKLAEILAGPGHVVLDLGGVTFMDSTGLAAIVSALNQAERVGAQLEIASPLPPQPRRLLELTGFLQRLAFTPAPPRPPA